MATIDRPRLYFKAHQFKQGEAVPCKGAVIIRRDIDTAEMAIKQAAHCYNTMPQHDVISRGDAVTAFRLYYCQDDNWDFASHSGWYVTFSEIPDSNILGSVEL